MLCKSKDTKEGLSSRNITHISKRVLHCRPIEEPGPNCLPAGPVFNGGLVPEMHHTCVTTCLRVSALILTTFVSLYFTL